MVAADTGGVPSSSHIYCCHCWRAPKDPGRRFWNMGSRRWSGPGSSSSRLKEDPCKLSVLQCQQHPPPHPQWSEVGWGPLYNQPVQSLTWIHVSVELILKILWFLCQDVNTRNTPTILPWVKWTIIAVYTFRFSIFSWIGSHSANKQTQMNFVKAESSGLLKVNSFTSNWLKVYISKVPYFLPWHIANLSTTE